MEKSNSRDQKHSFLNLMFLFLSFFLHKCLLWRAWRLIPQNVVLKCFAISSSNAILKSVQDNVFIFRLILKMIAISLIILHFSRLMSHFMWFCWAKSEMKFYSNDVVFTPHV